MVKAFSVSLVLASVVVVSCADNVGDSSVNPTSVVETKSCFAEVEGGRLYYESRNPDGRIEPQSGRQMN